MHQDRGAQSTEPPHERIDRACRRTIRIPESLPDATPPAVLARIKAARTDQAALQDNPARGNGLKRLLVKAARHGHAAAHGLHREHWFAGVAGAPQIAILLASVSIVTAVPGLRWAAGAIGGAAIIVGLLIRSGVV